MIRTIFFDLYGTLAAIETCETGTETASAFENWVKNRFGENSSLRERHRPLALDFKKILPPPGIHREPDIALTIGEHLEFVLQRQPLLEEIAETAVAFRQASRRDLQLFPGVKEALALLRPRFGLGLVSNAQALFTYPELRELGLEGQFQPLIISSELGVRKPSEEIFRRALELAGVSASEALFVGNDPREDIEGAAGVGMHTAWVKDLGRRGGGLPKEPDITVESVFELTRIL